MSEGRWVLKVLHSSVRCHTQHEVKPEPKTTDVLVRIYRKGVFHFAARLWAVEAVWTGSWVLSLDWSSVDLRTRNSWPFLDTCYSNSGSLHRVLSGVGTLTRRRDFYLDQRAAGGSPKSQSQQTTTFRLLNIKHDLLDICNFYAKSFKPNCLILWELTICRPRYLYLYKHSWSHILLWSQSKNLVKWSILWFFTCTTIRTVFPNLLPHSCFPLQPFLFSLILWHTGHEVGSLLWCSWKGVLSTF